MADGVSIPASSDVLRDRFLRDLRLSALDTGVAEPPPTEPGSDWWLLAEAEGRLALGAYFNVASAQDDESVFTATGDALDELRSAVGLPVVPPSGSTGNVVPNISGTTTIVNGTAFVLPNGLRGHVVGTYTNPVQGDEVAVETDDVGSGTNLPAGQSVRFVSPPVNVGVDAPVSAGSPLTGGTDAESDDRKRARILNEYRNKPSGGNWGYYRQLVLDSLGSVRDCFVFPALGGPASQKIVPVKDFSVAENDFSRTMSPAALNTVRQAVFSKSGIGIQTVVQASADEPADASVLLSIPASSLSGGSGQGWVNQSPWPDLVPGDSGRVRLTAVASGGSVITVSAGTSASPVAAQTQVAWWSPVDRAFYTALVVSSSGSAGARVLTLDRPLVGKGGLIPSVGDYLSPAAVNLPKYGASWVQVFRALGPGENTADPAVLPRALRRPLASSESQASVTNVALASMAAASPEITDISFGYRSITSPTVPPTVADPPNILVPRHFAVYQS